MSVRERPSPPSALVFGPSHQEAALPRGVTPVRIKDPYFQAEDGSDRFRLLYGETQRVIYIWRKSEKRWYPVQKVDLLHNLPDQDLLQVLTQRASAAELSLDAYLERLATLSR